MGEVWGMWEELGGYGWPGWRWGLWVVVGMGVREHGECVGSGGRG